MKGPGLRVPRARGEDSRRRLRALGLLRTDLEILREGEYLVLPVDEGTLTPPDAGELVVREFAVVAPPGPADYRDLLPWPPPEKMRLPRAFDVVGDIVLVRLPEEVRARREEIGEALLKFVPSARLVGEDLGVHGPERRRRVERIAGSGGWRTRHRENGLEFEVDVERAYFSPRLAREHELVASDVQRGERVYDLCCGVGPFAVTIARDGRASHVTAVDGNPAAVDLLRATLARYPFAGRVTALQSSLESFLPSAGPVDRVIFNLPHEGIKYLSSVARTVAARGRLHYYEVTPRAEVEQRGEAVVDSLGSPDWKLLDRHVVHPYSPGADLTAFTLERSER